MLASPNVTVSVVLLALVVGVSLPALVQLFVTLRSLQKTVTAADQRLERTLADVSAVAAHLNHPSAGNNQVAATIGAAVAPAIVAAIQAFRHHKDPEPTELQAKSSEKNGEREPREEGARS